MADYSVVEYFAEHENYKCGYCGHKDTNYSHGMWCHMLTVQDYQDLIDRGWRRSGCYSYKPTMDQTCCPQYTIKCKALELKISKSQKKVLKRMNNYLNHGTTPGKPSDKEKEGSDPPTPSVSRETAPYRESNAAEEDVLPKKLKPEVVEAAAGMEGVNASPAPAAAIQDKSRTVNEDIEASRTSDSPKKTPKPGVGADPSKPTQKKAKLLRRERWAKKHPDKSLQPCKKQPEGKTLDDYMNETVPNPAHKLEVKLVRSHPRSPEFNRTFGEVYKLYHKYQTTIHHDPPDKPSERQYTRFLVDSPLEEKRTAGGFKEGLGSFHQQYWLDGRLVAVGVVDLLPNCVSSVYLFYDPDFHFLSLGTYTALREAHLVRELAKQEPSLQYYYMGFYIHSCPKMRYKGSYVPSYLLCPKSYTWNPIEQCRPKLDQASYCIFDDKDDDNTVSDLRDVKVLHRRQAMPYAIYRTLGGRDDEDEVRQYANLVGGTCAHRLLLYRK